MGLYNDDVNYYGTNYFLAVLIMSESILQFIFSHNFGSSKIECIFLDIKNITTSIIRSDLQRCR